MQVQDDYKAFLLKKLITPSKSGFDVEPAALNTNLFPFQRDIVQWALQLGRAAIFAQVGMGKTIMQLSWAQAVAVHTSGAVLILAPLAVSHQTVREGVKFGITVQYVSDMDAVHTGYADGVRIFITNYERLDKFQTDFFHGVVLDESSILKSYMGKTKQFIITAFGSTPYKLACTATPAPNDHMELGNHSEFLGVLPSSEMLMRWFVNDTMKAGGYRIKGHAESDFWRWLTSWAVCLTKPSDLGDYDDTGYNLPELKIHDHYIPANQVAIDLAQSQGRLMPDTAPSSTELGRVKRLSLSERVQKTIDIIASIPDTEPILIWCNMNDEELALTKAITGAVAVRGSDKPEVKAQRLLDFTDGKIRILITKASIAGFGMNWQHCNQVIFFGIDFSFESFYQAKGRTHRYGQLRPVNCHVIYSELEGNVISTLYEKQDSFTTMQSAMAKSMFDYGLFRNAKNYGLVKVGEKMTEGKNYKLLLGDCVERTKELPDNSIDFGVHSPPFKNLYVYSDSEADMGNSADDDEFFTHYKFLIKDMHRITKPGRLCAVHCKDLPSYMNRDGAAGLIDFPGQIIKAFTECGWQYHSRVTIWKDPVIEMQRTKNHGLLHKNFVKESNACRQGMADYLVVFRKWEDIENQVPVTQKRTMGDYVGTNPPELAHVNREFNGRTMDDNYSIAVWQRYASPVWFDIDQTNVLNYQIAKSDQDEKHICPLQLDVIERAIDLWSNKGETVFSPFSGVGSEGYSALKLGRKYIGIELKPEYYQVSIKYLNQAELLAGQQALFDMDNL